MGLKGSDTVSLTFEDCRIPASAQLGQPQQGFAIAMMALDGGRIGISAQATGIAMAALEEAAQYAKDRRQFDRPISDFQAIQWFLADSRTELDAGRLLCLRAAQLKLEGKPFTREASMAKLFASEAAGRICDRNLQVHGGYGYVHDFAAERHVRDVRVTRIYEGTSEIQRTVIARSVLRG
jgi:alkylation response protein AidB-like acyl-CoA dehydrogenase